MALPSRTINKAGIYEMMGAYSDETNFNPNKSPAMMQTANL
jgi:hypothetical protein